MSYDVIIWQGRPDRPAGEIWEAVYGGACPDGVRPMPRATVLAAFTRVFGEDGVRDLGWTPGVMGPGFEVGIDDPATYLHITCSWGLLEDAGGLQVLNKLRRVAHVLGAELYNPQLDAYQDEAF